MRKSRISKPQPSGRFGAQAAPKTWNASGCNYLGRKGALTAILRGLEKLDPEVRRRRAGQEANRAKEALEAALDLALTALEGRGPPAAAPVLDVTLPGRRPPLGRLHPLNQVMAEVCDIFLHLGFEAVEGPEVELDWYNFEALNLPPDHPARDMQDTFYFNDRCCSAPTPPPCRSAPWSSGSRRCASSRRGRSTAGTPTSPIPPCSTRWRACWWTGR